MAKKKTLNVCRRLLCKELKGWKRYTLNADNAEESWEVTQIEPKSYQEL